MAYLIEYSSYTVRTSMAFFKLQERGYRYGSAALIIRITYPKSIEHKEDHVIVKMMSWNRSAFSWPRLDNNMRMRSKIVIHIRRAIAKIEPKA